VKLALVVLAAGASSRLGECKALCELGGASALAHVLAAARGGWSAARELELARPLVVAGKHAREIRAALPLLGAEVDLLEHAGWERGRSGGLARAARARAGHDLCIAPVDCPLVSAETQAALLRAWLGAGAPARGWLAPCVGAAPARRHGHPIYLGRELASALAAWPDERPLRELRASAEPLLAEPVADEAVLDSLDTPSDRERLRARCAARAARPAG
jgi:molybdenum cofactor cytidylyltransferase